jgi:hypothetical protein
MCLLVRNRSSIEEINNVCSFVVLLLVKNQRVQNLAKYYTCCAAWLYYYLKK